MDYVEFPVKEEGGVWTVAQYRRTNGTVEQYNPYQEVWSQADIAWETVMYIEPRNLRHWFREHTPADFDELRRRCADLEAECAELRYEAERS
jgi:hypothetical protein